MKFVELSDQKEQWKKATQTNKATIYLWYLIVVKPNIEKQRILAKIRCQMMLKVKKGGTYTSSGAVVVNGLDHGGDLIFANRSESLNPLGREKLKSADLPDLHVVGPIVGPDEVLAVLAELCGGSVAMPVCQFLVMVFEHLSRQFCVRNDDVQGGSDPHRYDGSVGLSPLGVAAEPNRLNVV